MRKYQQHYNGVPIFLVLLFLQLLFIDTKGIPTTLRSKQRELRCSSNTTVPDSNSKSFAFSQELATKILQAARLSILTYDVRFSTIKSDVPPEFENHQSWCDATDATIVTRVNQTCYAAFRGTVGFNLLDQLQLYDSRMEDFGNCRVRAGFARAYQSRYYDEFYQAITKCMETNPSSELVVTGYSQGGSIAVVASIDLKDYNPQVITFGALRTLESPCEKDVDSSRHLRFVNVGMTEDEDNPINAYDFWPNTYTEQAIHVGHAFLIDAASSESEGVYLGLDEDTTRTPKSRDVHNYDAYHASLKNLLGDATPSCYPIILSGWENGHWCTLDDECNNGSFCVNGFCRATDTLRPGEACSDDHDCQSGVCTRRWWNIVEEFRCT